jgi:hypothetical protein
MLGGAWPCEKHWYPFRPRRVRLRCSPQSDRVRPSSSGRGGLPMGWFRSLFGAKENDVDPLAEIKHAAMERHYAKRRELESGPRASGEEIVEHAMRMIRGAPIGRVYNDMRRDDFCDALMIVLYSGQFSEEQATRVIHTREWVMSGGAKRLTFPDWFALEGAPGQLWALNQEWLQAALANRIDRGMSFNDWYINVKRHAPVPD